MSKNIIIGVLVLMSISLLGVVGLQLYWINDAIQVKQEEFDRSVNDALTKVVEKLETQEAVSVVTGQMATLKYSPDTIEATATPTATDNPKASAKKRKELKVTASAQVTIPPVKNESKEVQAATQTLTPVQWQHTAKGITQLYTATPPDSVKRIVRYRTSDSNTARPKAAQPMGRALELNRTYVHADSLHASRRAFSYHSRKAPDTLTKVLMLHNTPVRVSVDTLKFMALQLDSLKRSFKVIETLNPAKAAPITLRNDSLIIFRNGTYSGVSPAPESAARMMQRSQQAAASVRIYLKDPAASGSASPAQQEYRVTKSFTGQQTESSTILSAAQAGLKKQTELRNIKPSDIEKIEIKKEKLNDVVQQMVVEYVAKDVPLQKRLNFGNLQSLLQTELQNQGINLDFGYWVVSGQNDTVASQNVQPLKALGQPKYKASLFPNDIFDKPDYLGVYFADSRTYAIKSLWGMLALSALFTVVMIATFGATIHIIYKQKKLSEMKNDFINNMTHEFKTPIATISLAADAIANPKIYEHPEKIKHYTGIIRQENKRMNIQVENVLQIAQLEKNDFKLRFEPVDVHILITKAIESIRLQVEERLGQINIQLNALQHELRSDEVHLFNVICNLLDNANKYSPSTPEINLVTQNVEGGLLIAVEDKGMGMSKETQQRVFDKFYRVPTGNLHNVKGFGLGLSYVKAIVQAHKGNVRLRSELGKGSRFEIFLPLS